MAQDRESNFEKCPGCGELVQHSWTPTGVGRQNEVWHCKTEGCEYNFGM